MGGGIRRMGGCLLRDGVGGLTVIYIYQSII